MVKANTEQLSGAANQLLASLQLQADAPTQAAIALGKMTFEEVLGLLQDSIAPCKGQQGKKLFEWRVSTTVVVECGCTCACACAWSSHIRCPWGMLQGMLHTGILMACCTYACILM